MSTKGRPKVPPGRRPPPKPAERRRTLPLVGILIAVVAVLLVGALVFNAMTKDDASADVEQTRPVTVEGAALPRFDGTAAQDPGIGAEAPVLTGQGFDGGAITIGGPQTGSDGRPTLVMFVAHWCPHCQREVPLVVGWRADGTIPSDIDLVAVSTGVDPAYPNYPPSEWLADERWPGGIMADDADSTAAQAYGLSAYPYFVALDKDGKVVARDTGELTQDAIEQLVQQLEAS